MKTTLSFCFITMLLLISIIPNSFAQKDLGAESAYKSYPEDQAISHLHLYPITTPKISAKKL